MAIFENGKQDDWEQQHLTDECFFCGESIERGTYNTGGGVYWSSDLQSKNIVLHQVCAENLARHLMQDARTLKSVTKQEVNLRPSEKRETGFREKYFKKS